MSLVYIKYSEKQKKISLLHILVLKFFLFKTLAWLWNSQ